MSMPAVGSALEPVRRSIAAAADADAGRSLRAAEERAAATLAHARAEADRTVREARAAGAAEAKALAGGELARRSRQARTVVLSARRERYEEVRRRALRLLQRAGLDPVLRRGIIGALGPDAHIAPAPGGGLVGTAADRTVDCSLGALVEHVMPVVAGQIEEVWT
ncbi:hypothetical protein [Dactylosporangium sp. NPDC049140]|uniref:hypothetical protein n=1 Tax=Dactylosporangium sp. NPDC049140 TaxID=3155647 RepID=UPI0033D0E477